LIPKKTVLHFAKDAVAYKNKQDYIGTACIVLLSSKTKISDLSFNIQIFLSD